MRGEKPKQLWKAPVYRASQGKSLTKYHIPIDILIKEYERGMRREELAEKYGCTKGTIYYKLKHHGFKNWHKGCNKTGNSMRGKTITNKHKDILRQNMLGEKNPQWKGGISKLNGVCLCCKKEFQRPKCGRKVIHFCNMGCFGKYYAGERNNNYRKGELFIGDKNPNWRGGTHKLQTSIRYSYKGKEWIKNVFEQDNYTCQICGDRGGYLEVHHIISMKKLFNEFLLQYKSLDSNKDRNSLLIKSYEFEPFWEIRNGETLCKKCHKQKTFNKYEV